MRRPIVFVGDTHGDWPFLRKVAEKTPVDIPIIQVGDIGWWPSLAHLYPYHLDLPRPVHFIEGNHDHVTALHGEPPHKELVEVSKNLFYVPRGTVLDVVGHRIVFVGGARSIDRSYRRHNTGVNAWFYEEDVSNEDVELALRNAGDEPVDILVTHAAPEWMVDKYFPKGDKFLSSWGLPPDFIDWSAKRIELLWKELGSPQHFCGHMHKPIEDGLCRILDINEVYTYDPEGVLR